MRAALLFAAVPAVFFIFIGLYILGLFFPPDMSPKSDAERSWALYDRSIFGVTLMFVGDDDGDYLSLTCPDKLPSKVLVNVMRFKDAPYGEATVRRNGMSLKLKSVPKSDWSRYWKNPSYHQFETDLNSIAKFLHEPGFLSFQLTYPGGSMRRDFPTKGNTGMLATEGICGTTFVELCRSQWGLSNYNVTFPISCKTEQK